VTRRTASVSALLLAAALALAGCGDSGSDLSVSSVYMPQPVSDSMAAGFLVVANDGGSGDELTSVTSDVAGEVTLHTTVGQTMERAESLDVPAHGKLVLQSGGNHLMFEKLRRKPEEGDTVSLELHFTESDPIKVEMPVKSATYQPSSTTKSSAHPSAHSSMHSSTHSSMRSSTTSHH
jgi:periplasmic copper chaperone A